MTHKKGFRACCSDCGAVKFIDLEDRAEAERFLTDLGWNRLKKSWKCFGSLCAKND